MKMSGKFGAGTPTLAMLLAMLLLGVIAFALTRTRGAEQAATRKGVLAPLLVVGGIFMLVVLFFPRKFNFEFFPNMDQRLLTVKIEQDVGTTLDVTDATTRYVEKTLNAHFPEIKTISTSVGSTIANGDDQRGIERGYRPAQYRVETVSARANAHDGPGDPLG